MKVPISELVTGEPNPSEANAEVDAEVLATTVGRPVEGEPVVIDAAGRRAAAAHGIDLDAVLAAEKVRGRAGEVTRVPVASVHWLLIGVGGGEPDDLRRAAMSQANRERARRHTWRANAEQVNALMAERLGLATEVPCAV